MSVHSFIGQLNDKVHKSYHSVVSHDHRYTKQKSSKSDGQYENYGTFFDDLWGGGGEGVGRLITCKRKW